MNNPAALFIGPQSLWGLFGILPLATGLAGWCPPYAMLSISTCKVKKVDNQIVEGFKSGELDKAGFWIILGDKKVYIRYFPVRDEKRVYLGVLEVTQEIAEIQRLSGEKRLL